MESVQDVDRAAEPLGDHIEAVQARTRARLRALFGHDQKPSRVTALDGVVQADPAMELVIPRRSIKQQVLEISAPPIFSWYNYHAA